MSARNMLLIAFLISLSTLGSGCTNSGYLRVIKTNSFSEMGPFRRTILVKRIAQVGEVCFVDALVKVEYAKYSTSRRQKYAHLPQEKACSIEFNECALTRVIDLDDQGAAVVLTDLWEQLIDNTGRDHGIAAAKPIRLKAGCGPYSLLQIENDGYQIAFENIDGQNEFVRVSRLHEMYRITFRSSADVE